MITSTYNAYKDLVYNSTKGKYWTYLTIVTLHFNLPNSEVLPAHLLYTDFETNVSVFETD